MYVQVCLIELLGTHQKDSFEDHLGVLKLQTPQLNPQENRQEEKKAALNTSRTRAEKASAGEAYKTANRRVKHSVKADKRKYVESLAAEAEEAAQHGNPIREISTTPRRSCQRNLQRLIDLSRTNRGKKYWEKKDRRTDGKYILKN